MAKFLQLAPMQAMTDIFFMNTHHKIFGGFTEMMAPYILASNKSLIKVQNLRKIFTKLDDDITLIPQLLSNDAEGFLHYANLLYDLGFKKVNWNLGCPFPFVTKKQRGAGLLPYSNEINMFLQEVMPKLKPELSIKVRLGLHSNKDILPLISIFNQYLINELIIHSRIADQKYEGKADKTYFKEIFDKIKLPVIYNGDLLFKEQINEIEACISGIKGYMIGRGTFINPFITNQINGVEYTHSEKIILYSKFYYELHNHYKATTKNDIGFINHMKQLWWYFSKSFENGEDYLVFMRSVTNLNAFESYINFIFENGRLVI